MYLRRLWMMLGFLAAFAVEAAVVYKWKDADGVVHFSDTAVPGAEKIVTSSVTSNGIGGLTAPGLAGTVTNKPPAVSPRPELSIESPTAEQVFFNDDAVSVRLHAEPGLKPGQLITWHLNGRALSDAGTDGPSFVLHGLDRGTYTLGATVTDPATSSAQNSPSVTFYVRQPSDLSLQHKKS